MPNPDIDHKRLSEESKRRVTESDVSRIRPITPFLRWNVSPWLEERVTKIAKGNIFTDWISENKSTGSISRPAICANCIRNSMELYIQSQSFLDQGLKGEFFVWYILAKEVEDATYSIDRAEGVNLRGVKFEVIRAFGGIPPDAEEAAERFTLYNRILRADPTGQSLIEYQVLRATQALFDYPHPKNEAFLDIYHPTRVLAAMHALELYKAFYHLTE